MIFNFQFPHGDKIKRALITILGLAGAGFIWAIGFYVSTLSLVGAEILAIIIIIIASISGLVGLCASIIAIVASSRELKLDNVKVFNIGLIVLNSLILLLTIIGIILFVFKFIASV